MWTLLWASWVTLQYPQRWVLGQLHLMLGAGAPGARAPGQVWTDTLGGHRDHLCRKHCSAGPAAPARRQSPRRRMEEPWFQKGQRLPPSFQKTGKWLLERGPLGTPRTKGPSPTPGEPAQDPPPHQRSHLGTPPPHQGSHLGTPPPHQGSHLRTPTHTTKWVHGPLCSRSVPCPLHRARVSQWASPCHSAAKAIVTSLGPTVHL